MARSWPSEPVATRQPWWSSPIRFSAGTSTSSKNTSLKSRSSGPTIDPNGRRVSPGLSVGITRQLSPLCLGASGSVRTNARMKSASWAPDVHTFWPFTTKRSPSSTARVRRPARSDPASGSLMPSAAVMSPRSSGTAHRRFCSSVPNTSSDGAMIDSPCGL